MEEAVSLFLSTISQALSRFSSSSGASSGILVGIGGFCVLEKSLKSSKGVKHARKILTTFQQSSDFSIVHNTKTPICRSQVPPPKFPDEANHERARLTGDKNDETSSVQDLQNYVLTPIDRVVMASEKISMDEFFKD